MRLDRIPTTATALTAVLTAWSAAVGAASPDLANAFFRLKLAKALPADRDLEVYVETRGGKIASAVGRAATFSKAPYDVDASGLGLAGGVLKGEIAVTLPSDGYNPPPGEAVRATYTIDAKVNGGGVCGAYEGRYGIAADGRGGTATKGAVWGTLAPPPSLAGPVTLELDMVNAAGDGPIDKKVWERRGFLYITFRGGKPIQAIVHGHGDARQVNYFEAVVADVSLSFAAGRLTGTVTVRSTRGEKYVYTFDGERAGAEAGGAFTKTVGGRSVPGGVFVGSFEPVGDVPAGDAIYNIELLGAVAGGKQLNCFIPRKGGVFATGMGYSGAWNHNYHDVEPAGLGLQGDALRGKLEVTMNPDAYVPRDGKPVRGVYAIDARLHDGCVTGKFTGRFGDEEVSGTVVGRLAAPTPVPEPARFSIKLEDGVNQGAPWFRRVYLSFVATGGKADEGGMSNNKGGWQGTFKRAEVRFDGTGFTATIEGSVDTSRTALTGSYTFKLSGRAVGSELVGKVETWLDGRKTKEGTPFMGGFAPAAASQPRPRLEAGPSGAAAWLDCTLSGVPETGKLRLLILTIGDRVERAVVQPLGMAAVDVGGLKLAGVRITGQVVIGHEPRRENKSVPSLASRMPLRLDLKLAGNQVGGTFAGSWPKPRSVTTPVDVRGTVTGVRKDEEALRSANGLRADATWPSWLGPNQNFSSGPCDRPLVEDLADARLVWASRYIGPPEGGSHRYGACVGTPPAAGGASPLVWRGKVYQFRFQPAGEVHQKHLDTILAGPGGEETRRRMQAVGWTLADMRRRWAVDADEQLICIDAATGRTLWTVTWPGEGLLVFSHKCGLTNHTGAVAEVDGKGRVYVFGALGIVRCVDAETGEVMWAAPVPGYSEYMGKLKAKALAERHLAAPTRSFCHGLNVSGSTVVAPDGIGSCGLVGLDGRTGKVLWRVGKVLGKLATPMAWSAGGRHYVIAANGGGAITCIDAADGKVAWQCADAGANDGQTLLAGDLLIANATGAERHKKLADSLKGKTPQEIDPGAVASAPGSNFGQVACWRLSTKGAERVWAAPEQWGAPSMCPVGAALGELACFRGNYSYYIVRAATGERIASSHVTAPVRFDEGHMLALPGAFVLHPDTQHGQTKMFLLPAKAGAKAGPVWLPPHPHATTYQAPMSHAWADGRLFIRGSDAIYCYDLRRQPAGPGEPARGEQG